MVTTNALEKTFEGGKAGEERSIPLGYGKIPHRFVDKVDQIISADHTLPVQNLDETLDISLEEPIGQLRLQEFIEPHHKIAIIVSDRSRKLPRERMIEAIHREILRVLPSE